MILFSHHISHNIKTYYHNNSCYDDSMYTFCYSRSIVFVLVLVLPVLVLGITLLVLVE